MANPFLTAERIAECGLKPDSLSVLEKAGNAGYIHVSEIRLNMRRDITGNPTRLRRATAKLLELLDLIGIEVEYNGPYRKSATVPTDIVIAQSDVGSEEKEILDTYRDLDKTKNLEEEDSEDDAEINDRNKTRKLTFLDKLFPGLKPSDLTVLTPDQLLATYRRIRQGEKKASHELIYHNLRLVVHIAKKYASQNNLEDLIQEGLIGLMKAKEKFETESGTAFGTYASWWIRQSILLYIRNNNRTIRIPVHVHDTLRKIWETQTRLTALLGRNPTIDELAFELGLTPKRISSLIDAAKLPVELDQEVVYHTGKMGNSGNDDEYHNFVADRSAISPDRYAEAKDELDSLMSRVEHGFKCLTRLPSIKMRAIEMFKARWFQNGEICKQRLESTGLIFGVSRERIRQAESKCLRALEMRGIGFGGVNGWKKTIDRISVLSEMTGIVPYFSFSKKALRT